MQRYSIKIAVSVFFFSTIFILPLYAKEVDPRIQELERRVEELRRLIANFGKKEKDPAFSPNASAPHPQITRTLKKGMRGNDVRDLQLFFKGISGIYPEGIVSGYFGSLTEVAVKRFQKSYNLPQIGIVGPRTKATIEEISLRAPVPPPLVVVTPEATALATTTSTKTAAATSSSEFRLTAKPQYDLTELALEIHNLVNEKRRDININILSWDSLIAGAATEHSNDQAKNNQEITNPDFLCHYPIIRHEGFMFGFTALERLKNRNIPFQIVGENIAMIPTSHNLMYAYEASNPPPDCKVVERLQASDNSKEAKTAAYEETLRRSSEAVNGLAPIRWVNRGWYSIHELAKNAVEAWMNSPGHRENLLRQEYTFGGIGVVEANHYVIITQNFVGR